MPANTFLYLGLAFTIFEIVKLLPLRKVHKIKMIQLLVLLIINISLIIIPVVLNDIASDRMAELSIFISLPVCIVTLTFTLLPFLLSFRLDKKLSRGEVIGKTYLPEIIYFLNWDKDSKSYITIKKIFAELKYGHLEKSLTLLNQANKDKDLFNYNEWHQRVLNILLITRNIRLAYSYLSSLKVDFDRPNIPAGLIYSMIRIYSEYGNYKKSAKCLRYLDTYYHDIHHRPMNLNMYLIFYALSGCEENFNALLRKYPKIQRLSTLPYWRAILLLKKGEVDIATTMLKAYLNKIPPEHRRLKKYINYIIDNPEVYVKKTEKTDTMDYSETLTPEETPEEMLVRETVPREENFKSSNVFIYNEKKRISATFVLCAFVVLITLLQFIIMLPKSFGEFLFLEGRLIYDYIRVGGINAELINEGQWIRFVIPILLHGDWIHLLFNIYGLFILGRLVERSFGKHQLLFIFLFSGIIGNLLTYIFHIGMVGVGASGGVFGILGAFIVYILWRRKDFDKTIFKRLMFNFAIIIGINVFYGLSNPEINNLAHFGGFIGGIVASLVYIFIYDKLNQIRKSYDIITGILSIIIFIVVLAMWYPLIISEKRFRNTVQYDEFVFRKPVVWVEEKEEINGKMYVDYYTGTKIILEKFENLTDETNEDEEHNIEEHNNNESTNKNNTYEENTFSDIGNNNEVTKKIEEYFNEYLKKKYQDDNNILNIEELNIDDALTDEDVRKSIGEQLEKNINQFASDGSTQYVLKDNLTKLEGDWYYYSAQIKEEDLGKYDYIYVYQKVFDDDILRIYTVELKRYSKRFDRIFRSKFLHSVKPKS